MTVKELKEILEDVPDYWNVFRFDGDHDGSTVLVMKVEKHNQPGWGTPSRCIVLD